MTLQLSVEGMTCASCVARVEKAVVAVPGVSVVAVNLASETVLFDGPVEPVLAALEAVGYPARVTVLTAPVEGMSCAGCAGRAQKGLAAVPGVIKAEVNLASETARVEYLEGAVTPEVLATAAKAAGYPLRLEAPEPAVDRKADEARALARQTVLAAVLTLPVFIVEMGGHLFPPLHHLIARTVGMQVSWVAQFVLVTLVLAGPGRAFFAKGLRALARRAPDMNSLVAVGAGAAYLYSLVATFAPGWLPDGSRAVYFEAAAVIVTLILLGRTLEARAKGRTGEAIRRLAGLRPQAAWVEREGEPQQVPIAEVIVDDVIHLRPGARVPVDGVVLTGASWLDEAMISGEPVPVEKTEGAEVIAGTVNGTGALTYRATRVGADTVLARIMAMVQDAQAARLPIQGMVDRITLWFVPAVLVLALLTVAVWLAFAPSLALVAGVSVLIIACPCAMGLATPTSIMVGTGRAAELGVLFRRGDALQGLAGVVTVAMDKTGTLTMGRPELTDFVVQNGFNAAEALGLLAGAEAGSEHPVAEAIRRGAVARGAVVAEASAFEALPGYGIHAEVAGSVVLAGAARLMVREGVALPADDPAERLAAKGRTPMYLAVDGVLAAVLAVADPVKPGSAAAVAALRAQGLRVVMMTGDAKGTAEAVARELGVDEVVAELLPEGKVDALKALQAKGPVAFVGDGINDAPVLATADVGIALGTGTDVAMEAADVVLMAGDPGGVVSALEVSRTTLANIRQNLIWAFGYNVALIPVAAGVLYPFGGPMLSPMLAAGAMALSSVFVVSNALRLRRVGQERDATPAAPVLREARA